MPKYRDFIYGDGHVYGNASRVLFNAEPLTATALSHSKIQVTWTKPSNSNTTSYIGFRLVRNQDAFPETEEDGTILYEFYSRTGATMPISMFVDGEDVPAAATPAPLVPGRFSYYRAWILLDSEGEWVRAGDVFTLLPSRHLSGTSQDSSQIYNDNGEMVDYNLGSQTLTTTHDRFLEFFPRALISKGRGPLDEVEPYISPDNPSQPISDPHGSTDNSLLNTFLAGFSLTMDEMLDFAEAISPELSGKNTSPEILSLQSQQLGLAFDTAGMSKSQKRLVREALYIYRRKGTLAGLQALVEAITGYDAAISVSRNIMLSPQDSTFFEGTGFWTTSSTCTLEALGYTITSPTSEDEPQAIEFDWVGKVTPEDTDAYISLGTSAPITRGIPVTPGVSYNISTYVYSSASSGAGIVPTVYWYDIKGKLLSTNANGSGPLAPYGTPLTVTGDWSRVFFMDQLAPVNAAYMGLSWRFTTADVYYLDMMQVAEIVPGVMYEDYQEARGVEVFLNAPKTNLILDPSFSNSAHGYTFTGNASHSIVAVSSGGVYDGPIGARPSLWKLAVSMANTKTFGFTTSNSAVNGKFYSFSLYAKASAPLPATISLGLTDSATITIGTEWERYSFTSFIEGDGSAVTLTPTFATHNTSGSTITLNIDCVQLEAEYYPTDYFDGSLTLSGGAWEGTAGASVSHMYPARSNKLTRLANEIENFLPINTPYRVDMVMNDGAILPPKGIS